MADMNYGGKKRRMRKKPADGLPDAYMCCAEDCSLNRSIVYYGFNHGHHSDLKGTCPKCGLRRCWVSLSEDERYQYKFGDEYPLREE